MNATRQEMQQEALSRAVGNQSLSNWPAIFAGFSAKGIAENDIRPRENVFTYHAWRALGRQVRRGEHGIKVTTFVPMTKKTGENDPNTGEEKKVPIGKRAWTATVFHVSQTDPIDGPAKCVPLDAQNRGIEGGL
jgi:N-terminal domain of anti-restriction factor ArdC